MMYAAVVMRGVVNGVSQEASREFANADGMAEAIKELCLDQYNQSWQAITIVHLEDLPRIMQGTRPV